MAALKDKRIAEMSGLIGNALAAKIYHSSDHAGVQEVAARLQDVLCDQVRPGADVLVALVIMVAECIEGSPYGKEEMILAVADLLRKADIRMQTVQ